MRTRWSILGPFIGLFTSYVFGVAVELLGWMQLVIRVAVMAFCLFALTLLKDKIPMKALILRGLFVLYCILVFVLFQSPLMLNFIYLISLLLYFEVLRIEPLELLRAALIAMAIVLALYLVYFAVTGFNLGQTRIGGRIRYGFGFTNSNKVGITLFSAIVGMFLYASLTGKLSRAKYVLGALLLTVLYLSDSRTPLLSLLLYAFVRWRPLERITRRVLPLLPLVFLLISFQISLMYDNLVANIVLSYRPVDFHAFIKTMGPLNYLLGGNSTNFRVDNSYILAYFSIGPLGYLIFTVLLFRAARRWHHPAITALFAALLSYGLMESVLIRVEFPIIILMYYLLLMARVSGAPREGGDPVAAVS